MANILIIDDDENFCSLLQRALKLENNEILCAYTLAAGLTSALSGYPDVVFLDVRLPDGSGLEKIQEIRSSPSRPEVIILTGAGMPDGAELAIDCGAWDYIEKPAPVSTVRLHLLRALQYRGERLKGKTAALPQLAGIIGSSPRMKDIYESVAEAAATDINVLITGETGTGKELFAKALHENGRRAGRNFVVVDCAALHGNLIESTLFGYQKGAFTGADENREGLIKQADGGTLFLDEIGELPLSLQRSFLRVLQERRFRPLGNVQEVESNFRLIAATNRNLETMAQAGQFREDLLFRICSFTIALPPLRERLEDIGEIARYYTAKICKRMGLEVKELSPDILDALRSYNWPGNVRELINALERAIAAALSVATLFRKHLPRAIRVQLANSATGNHAANDRVAKISPPRDEAPQIPFFPELPKLKELRRSTYEEVEKKYLQELLKVTEGDLELACRISDLSRTRFYELLRKHKLPLAE